MRELCLTRPATAWSKTFAPPARLTVNTLRGHSFSTYGPKGVGGPSALRNAYANVLFP